jgi:hypothetical protein
MTASPGCKRDLRLGSSARRNQRVMTPQEFEARIIDWARRQSGVEALVLAGSRAHGGVVDEFADWDFHLISTRPTQYQCTDWLSEIAPLWCANAELTPRGVIKVSAIFEGGHEVDFIPLASWKMKMVYWAMRHPEWVKWMPTLLHRGIIETRAFLLGSGYRVVIGRNGWEKRLTALNAHWNGLQMTTEEFTTHAAAFWQKAIWLAKKIARPEPRSAMHWLHKLITDHVYALLAEEARLAGRSSRPEARKAEQWLDAKRLTQTAVETGTDQRVLARALLGQITLFEEVCRSVAGSRGWEAPDYSAVAAWLRQELGKLVDRP